MPHQAEIEDSLENGKNRLRLKRRESDLIESRLKKIGFRTSRSDGMVHAWSKDGHWTCSFRWLVKKGWRLDISQPIIWSRHDLQTALDEIETTRHHDKLTEEAWRVYTKCRSDKAWMAYQGMMAAHFARLGAIPRKNEIPNRPDEALPNPLQAQFESKAHRCLVVAANLLGKGVSQQVLCDKAVELMDLSLAQLNILDGDPS